MMKGVQENLQRGQRWLLGMVAVLCLGAGVSWGQTLLWSEDFESYSVGDLLAQDATWTSVAGAALTAAQVDVVAGQEMRVYAEAPNNVGYPRNYAFKNINSLGINGNIVTISFRMMHPFTNMYYGKGAGMGFLSASKGWMFSLEMRDAGGTATINGNPIDFPAGNVYHDYVMEIDFEADSITVTIDGTNTYGPYSLMGGHDWSPFDMVGSATSGLNWFAGLYYNNSYRSNYVRVDNITITQANPVPVLWIENFEGYALGDLLPQDAAWTQTVAPALTDARAQVVSGQKMYLYASAPTRVAQVRNTVYRDLTDVNIIKDQVQISFTMEHSFSTLYHGKVAGMALISSTKGTMLELSMFDTNGVAYFNGTQFTFPAPGSHAYVIDIDFATDSCTLSVDGNIYGPYGLLGSTDWTPADCVSTTADSGLAWFCGLYYNNSPRDNALYVDDIMVTQGTGSSGGEYPFEVEGAELRSLVVGRNLFTSPDDHIRWDDAPIADINCCVAVTGLNRAEPLVVTTEAAGYLYALLWRWDFGILAHDWSALPSLHGWTLVDAGAGAVQNFTAPLSPLPLYRRPVSAGTHDIPVADCVGQWVLVGFVEDGGAVSAPPLPTVTLAGAATRYNVFDPCAPVDVQTSGTRLATRLCRNGQVDQPVFPNPLMASFQPGRYWLEVDFAEGTRVVPLTVGLGPVPHPGWQVNDFFPINSYGGGGYLNNANTALSGDLTTLAQFELGYNTFFVSRDKTAGLADTSLIDALGGRRLYTTLNYTRWPIRDIEDDTYALDVFFWSLSQFEPGASNALAFYVEDEPPHDTRFRMGLAEDRFAVDYAGTDLHMLYCTFGHMEYWQDAGTTSGMFRAYPFYKSLVGDIPGMQAMLENTLLNGIANWRVHNPGGPLWLITQAFGDTDWAIPTAEQVRLQVNLALARGVNGLTHFFWPWQGKIKGVALWPYVPADDRYAELGQLHEKVKMLKLHQWRWVEEIPQSNGDFDVQRLENAHAGPVAWITNMSWTEARSGSVDLPGFATPYAVSLAPGDSEIVSLCPSYMVADMTGDCTVDMADWGAFAQSWLMSDLRGDLNDDGVVDMTDVAQVGAQWLLSPEFP